MPITAAVSVAEPNDARVIKSYVSNTATMAVSSGGGACSDPLTLPASSLQTGAATGTMRLGAVSLVHNNNGQESATAAFATYPFAAWSSSGAIARPPAGSSNFYTLAGGTSPIIPDAAGLNAGTAINITRSGASTALSSVATGKYSGKPASLAPGQYTLDNGAGLRRESSRRAWTSRSH